MNNNIKNDLLNVWHKLTSTEQEVLDYIFSHFSKNLKIKVLSEKTNASQSTISNLVKKIGFDGYREFMYEYERQLLLENDNNVKREIKSKILGLHTKIIEIYDQWTPDEKLMNSLINSIEEKDVFSLGLVSSLGALNDMRYRFARFGKLINVASDSDSLFIDMNVSSRKKLLIILSLRGEKEIFDYIIKKSESIQNLEIVIVTSTTKYLDNPNITTICLPKDLLKNYQRFDNVSGQNYLLPFIDIISELYINKNFEEIVKKWSAIKKILK